MEFNELKDFLTTESNKFVIKDIFFQKDEASLLISKMLQDFEDACNNEDEFLQISEEKVAEINDFLRECLDIVIANKFSTLEHQLFTAILELLNNYIEACPKDYKFDFNILKALNILDDSRHNYEDLIYLFIFLENRFKTLLTQSDNEFVLSQKYYQEYQEFLQTFGASRYNKYTFDN